MGIHGKPDAADLDCGKPAGKKTGKINGAEMNIMAILAWKCIANAICDDAFGRALAQM